MSDQGLYVVSLGGREVSVGWRIRIVGFGVRTNGVEVPGGVVLVVVDGSVVVRLRSIAELSCADGALDAASSSESSELKPVRGISEMMGRDRRVVDSGPEVDLCFFLGCGSSVEVARCLDRTGTGVVIRVVARGRSGPDLGSRG